MATSLDHIAHRQKRKEDMEIKDVVKTTLLPFLPAKTLFRFKSVSHEWNLRITSPFLAHEQSYHFRSLSGFFCQSSEKSPTFASLDDNAYGVPTPSLTFLPEPVDIISSRNGLLLCQERHGNNSYYICNPTNQEWRKIPCPKYYHGCDPATILAFEPSKLGFEAHYELICAVPFLDQPIVCFEIYSSETRSWRISDTWFVDQFGGNLRFTGNHFYTNGIAYWETSERQVLAFDAKNEAYELISLHCEAPLGGVLTQIKGELCYVGVDTSSGDEYSIMIYSGMDMSLKHVASVSIEGDFLGYRILPCLDGDNVMILEGGGFIYSYSTRDRTVRVVCKVDVDCRGADKYVAYVNSMVNVG